MLIYWLILIWACFFGYFWKMNPAYQEVSIGQYEPRVNWPIAIITFFPMIYLLGLRSAVGDTPAYIMQFIDAPATMSQLVIPDSNKGPGFLIFQTLFKQYISSDYHMFLLFICAVSGFCVMLTFKKYSSNFLVSIFLFIASAQFTWLLNGIRQFICISIIFACTPLVIKGKWVKFFIIVLLLSTIHQSAIIFIPAYFVIRAKAWNPRVIIATFLTILILMFTNVFTSILTSSLAGNAYQAAADSLSSSGVGTNIFRVLVSAVPMVMAFINRKKIEKIASPFINICINMSVLTTLIYLISTVTSGIEIGRLPEYFDIFNLILIPWIIEKCYSKSKAVMYGIMTALYLLFFYHQMVSTWHMFFSSDYLHIYYG